MPDASHTRRPAAGTLGRALRRLGLLLSSLAIGLLLAEVGTRLLLRVRGEAWDEATAVSRVETILEGMLGVAEGVPLAERERGASQEKKPVYELHPYAGYLAPAGFRRTEEVAASFAGADHEERYDVFLFGGSVAAGFSGKGMDVLLAAAAATPEARGRPIHFESFAIPGHKQPQQLMLLTYLFTLGCRPDLVVNLDGLNELRIARSNGDRGLEPTFPSIGQWATVAAGGVPESPAVLDATLQLRRVQARADAFARRALDGGWFRSAIVGRWALSRMRRERAEWSTSVRALEVQLAADYRERRTRARSTRPELDAVLDETVSCWFEASLAMHQLCAARGARYLHLLQPTLHDEGSKPVSAEEREIGIGADGLDESVVAGYPRLRAGIARLAASGVEALDTSDAFAGVSETLYLDSCHFSGKGKRLLARRAIELLGLGLPEGTDGE